MSLSKRTALRRCPYRFNGERPFAVPADNGKPWAGSRTLRRRVLSRALSQRPEALYGGDLDDENTRLVLNGFRACAHDAK